MIELPAEARLADLQRYVHDLEAKMGWSDVDLVRTCFLMGEEVGELFRAVRDVEGGLPESLDAESKQAVAHEIVDVLNYLLAVANRLDIDVEAAFREKNRVNQGRSWE